MGIEEYAKVFWKRYTEIADYDKYISLIEAGEEKTRKTNLQRKLLRKKMEMYRVPLQQLKINYTVSTTNKKVYTEEEDRFLLVMLDKYGLDSEGLYEKIRDEIRESPLFRFDWFFLSRTPQELSRRCATLITTVTREFEGGPPAKENKRGAEDAEEEEEEEEKPAAKKGRSSTGTAKNKTVNGVKGTPNGTSRAASEDTTASGGAAKSRARGRKSGGK